MNAHNLRVADFYNKSAALYDTEFVEKAYYALPNIVQNELGPYASGTILDIGCGTGKLTGYLNNQFTIDGIEVSENMAQRAAVTYRTVHYGPAEEILPRIPSKSFDHVVALSSLYFIENIDQIIWETGRIARKSILVSLEHFNPGVAAELAKMNGLKRFNHSSKKFGQAKVLSEQHLWNIPGTHHKIFGDVVHKILVPP